MTIDVGLMIDVRDAQVAMEVQQRAEMGWFDVEFTMYGCAFMEDGKRKYHVSAYEEKIYEFTEHNMKRDILPTTVQKITRKYPVPTGMRDEIAVDVKKELAKNMSQQYPTDFFEYLNNLAVQATEETAMPFLNTKIEQVSGCFDLKQISQVQHMVEYAYFSRKIGIQNYHLLLEWLAEEKKSMEESFIAKDVFEKTFYGLAYREKGVMKYVVNARKEFVYRKKQELENKRIFFTPIYSDTYYFNHDISLPQAREMFAQDLKQVIDQSYMEQLEQIYMHNTKISADEYTEHLDKIKIMFGIDAEQTARHYGYQWGILW